MFNGENKHMEPNRDLITCRHQLCGNDVSPMQLRAIRMGLLRGSVGDYGAGGLPSCHSATITPSLCILNKRIVMVDNSTQLFAADASPVSCLVDVTKSLSQVMASILPTYLKVGMSPSVRRASNSSLEESSFAHGTRMERS
jgi:hypothetical protein